MDPASGFLTTSGSYLLTDYAISVAITSAGHHGFGESSARSFASSYPSLAGCLGGVARWVGVLSRTLAGKLGR